MREARPGRFARQGRAVTRGKAGQIREARQGRCARQGRADAGGKEGQAVVVYCTFLCIYYFAICYMTEMERYTISPVYLWKDELEYEIYVRKGQALPHRKVGDLQKILREVGRESVDLQYLQILDFEGELRTIDAKVNEFNETVVDCRADAYISPGQYARVTSRLRHLTYRVADFISCSRVKRDKLAVLEGFRAQTVELTQAMAELYASTIVVTNDPGLSSVSHAHNPTVIASVDNVSSEARGSFYVGHPSQQPPAQCQPALRSSTCPQLLPAFQCARLPNPIEKILSQQSVLSRDTFDSVLAFLKLLVQVKVHALVLGIMDVHILLILYPYTVGILSNRLSEAISTGCSVDKFHMDTLNFFLPPRARISLYKIYCFRVQADNESLANYIADVKCYVKVYRLENSEPDIVQSILDGLSPACRSYLVFADKPTSYAGLDHMCVQAANAEYADKLDRHFPSLQLVLRPLIDQFLLTVHPGHALLLSVFIAIAKGM
jgi:hypothetical protein